MIEEDSHHFLWDVAVDQPAGEGVAPLVRGQVHRTTVFVVHLARPQPPAEPTPVGAVAERRGTHGVGVWSGEQMRAAVGPALQHPALLGAEYFGMTVGQTIKTWSVMETVLSVVGLVLVLLLAW